MIGTQMRPFNDYITGIQNLLPTIKFFIERSPTKEEKMSFEDVVRIMGEKIENFNNDTLESVVCGTSQALFQQGISTKININPTMNCIYFIFKYSTPRDILPTLETCDTNWNNLIELPTKEKEERYKPTIQKLVPLIKNDLKSMEDQKRNEVMYYASFLAGAMGKEFINDNVGSIFCGIAPTMFDNGIVTDINISQEGCFVYIFRNATIQDKRPIIDNCIERWIILFVEK